MSKQKAKKTATILLRWPPRSQEKQEETEDVYDTETREAMLDEDDITAAEEGFMKGHEQEPPAKKETRKNAVSHDDTVSVELAKEDSEDD